MSFSTIGTFNSIMKFVNGAILEYKRIPNIFLLYKKIFFKITTNTQQNTKSKHTLLTYYDLKVLHS